MGSMTRSSTGPSKSSNWLANVIGSSAWYRLGDNAQLVTDIAAAQAPANASNSRLGDAVQEMIYSSRPDMAIVLSDFRVNAGSELPAIASQLGQDGLPPNGIWTVGLGTTTAEPTVHLDEIVGPNEITIGDAFPLIVRASIRGQPDTPITARLLRQIDGGKEEEIAKTTQPLPASDDPLFLTTIELPLSLQVETLGLHQLIAEVSDGQRTDRLAWPVRAGERGINLLILAEHPRFEFRYLQAAAQRDPMITVHSYLAAGGWRRWGDASSSNDGAPATLPRSMLDLERYDAVIIGDIDATALSQELQLNMRRLVTERGAGLIWIPGERGATSGFRSAHLGAFADSAAGCTTAAPRIFRRSPA